MGPVRVLVADDHAILRQGIKSMLEARLGWQVVGEAANGRDAVEKAARLLKSGNLRVSQVARRCGFDSENYFRQQFRQRFGMSPRQFRSNGIRGVVMRRPQVA